MTVRSSREGPHVKGKSLMTVRWKGKVIMTVRWKVSHL